MAMGLDDSALEALDHFGSVTPVVLATVDNRKPVLRRVTLIRAGARFYLCTYRESRKVKHLNVNDSFAVLLSLNTGDDHGYVELFGTVRKVTRRSEKKEVEEIAGFLGEYWEGIDDPCLIMYELVTKGGAYLKPGFDSAEEFSLA